MQRRLTTPLTAAAVGLALVVSGCGSGDNTTRPTVTKIVTATDTAPATSTASGTGTGTGITVVKPDGSGSSDGGGTTTSKGDKAKTTKKSPKPSKTTGKSSKKTSAKTSQKKPSKTHKTTPVKKVDPTKSACPALLDARDIKKALDAKVSTDHLRIVDVANPDVKMTARIKCYYGTDNLDKARPVVVALAQYASKNAAQAQLNTTVSSEKNLGADASTVDVSGHKANVLLRDGGLLIMRYDTWTLSVATANKLAPAKALPKGLQAVARMVLARVLKG